MKHLKIKIPFIMIGTQGGYMFDMQYMSDEELGYLIGCFEQERSLRIDHKLADLKEFPVHKLKSAKDRSF